MTLYLKYRPQTISELDLDGVRASLTKILGSELPHAFLFAGPKGTGKTSAARILAKVINCQENKKLAEPCNKCEACLSITKGHAIDVIEMDAASNRGIDDIRALRESIMLAPTALKKKVYIIDEAHMLTIEAANAFLKTLEEPPDHVIFILATTDPQKLPDTVRSRLITINFSKATTKEITRQLERVIAGEKMKVEEGVIALIAKAADGSFRDAVKILESLSLGEEMISLSKTQDYLYQNKGNSPGKLLELLAQKQCKEALYEIKHLSEQGVSIKQYIGKCIEVLRDGVLSLEGLDVEPVEGFEKGEIVHLLELLIAAYADTAKSPINELPLEMAIIKWCQTDTKQISNSKKDLPLPQEKKAEVLSPKMPEVKGELSKDVWAQILLSARDKNMTVDALLRAAVPLNFDGKTLLIGVYYRFHKERLEVLQNKMAMENICEEIIGNPVSVAFTLAERKTQPQADPPLTRAKDEGILSAAKEIFGN